MSSKICIDHDAFESANDLGIIGIVKLYGIPNGEMQQIYLKREPTSCHPRLSWGYEGYCLLIAEE